MKSREILPLEERPKYGDFKKSFDGKKSFDILYELMRKYHFALNAVEDELFQLPISSNSENIYPKRERHPLDTSIYNGVSKLDYYSFIKSVKKYHQALQNAEEWLENYKKNN